MENLKKIQAMLTQGIPFVKHNRKVLFLRTHNSATFVSNTTQLGISSSCIGSFLASMRRPKP